MRRWFDGHLDLAYLAQHGRNLSRTADSCGGGLQPASVTFPALREGNVRAAFATVFVQKRVREEDARRRGVEVLDGPWCFDTTDEAYLASLRQLAQYQIWDADGTIQLLADNVATGGGGESAPLQVVLLLEGAAGVRNVKAFREFYDYGVRIVALSWVEGTLWAGGDQSGGDVTAPGHDLIAELDRLGCVHDVSHLSEAAFWTLMSEAKGLKIASHSNCRALLPGKKFPERNLSDEQIRALVAAGGIVGVNLFSPFLVVADGAGGAAKRAGMEDVLRHLKHFEDVAGRRDFLALGSDFDGGYGRTSWAAGVDGPELLWRLADALSGAGWADAEIEQFAWGNWSDLVRRIGTQTVAS